MANKIFSNQRSDSGDVYFEQQVEGAFYDIATSLEVNTSLTATALKFVLSSFNSVANSTLLANLRVIPSTMRANMSATSTSTLTAVLVESRLSATLSAKSVVTSSLSQPVIVPALLSVELKSSPIVAAVLMLLGGSNIPLKAKLTAVPTESESLQIVRYRGDTDADEFQVFDDKTGLPIDITGCTFRMTLSKVKKPKTPDDIVYTLFGRIGEPQNGVVYFSPTASQANRVGFFYYDVELDDNKGLVKTLISSSYVYLQDITT